MDALTLDAQTLCQDINQGKLTHQQRDQLEQKAVWPHLEDKKPHTSSLVVDELRKTASLAKKMDRKLSPLGLEDDGQAFSSGETTSSHWRRRVPRGYEAWEAFNLGKKQLKLLCIFVTLNYGLIANSAGYMSARISHMMNCPLRRSLPDIVLFCILPQFLFLRKTLT